MNKKDKFNFLLYLIVSGLCLDGYPIFIEYGSGHSVRGEPLLLESLTKNNKIKKTEEVGL